MMYSLKMKLETYERKIAELSEKEHNELDNFQKEKQKRLEVYQ